MTSPWFKTPEGESQKDDLVQIAKTVNGRSKPEKAIPESKNRRNDGRLEPVPAPEYLTDSCPQKLSFVRFKASAWERIGMEDRDEGPISSRYCDRRKAEHP